MTYKKVNTDDFLYLKEIVGSDHIKMGKDIDPKYSHDQLGTAQHMPDIYIRIQDKHQVMTKSKSMSKYSSMLVDV